MVPAEPRRPRGRLPRVHPAAIVVIGAAAALVLVGMERRLSTDVFWHLATGRWMLAHHRVLRHDVLTYTVHGRRWVNAEWGFDVALAWSVRHLGPISYWVLGGGLAALALLVGAATWRRKGAGHLWTAVIAVVVAAPLSAGVAVRPQAASYLFFATELLVLTLARSRRRWLWALPPLLLLWANVHGSFLAGVGMVAIEAFLATVAHLFAHRDRWPLRLRPALRVGDAWAALAGVTAAACLNPHGPFLFLYDLRVSGSPQLASIEEWQPPDFHSAVVLATVGAPILIGIVALGLGRRRVAAFDAILWFGLLVLTLRSVRFAPYLGLALGGLLAGYPVVRRETIRPSVLALPLGALLAGMILLLPHPPAGTIAAKGQVANPVRAAAWLTHQHGRVFSTYAWNDYLDHVGIPVFVDGRTDLYFGTPVLPDYQAVSGLTVDPDQVLARYDVRWVLWPAHQPLSEFLVHDAHWQLVRQFGSDMIFERSGTSSS